MAEAASVALTRHYAPPATFEIRNSDEATERELSWEKPDERILRAHGNTDDSTRDGAYSIAIATVEAELGLVALSRSDVRTGADYYIGAPGGGVLDLENALRLEISGSDHGDDADLNRRLDQKLVQARAGQSDRPAIACVVGFAAKAVLLERAEED